MNSIMRTGNSEADVKDVYKMGGSRACFRPFSDRTQWEDDIFMIWMHVQMDSTALNMPVTLEILAPQPHGDKEGQKRRILFLLHDYGEDHCQSFTVLQT